MEASGWRSASPFLAAEEPASVRAMRSRFAVPLGVWLVASTAAGCGSLLGIEDVPNPADGGPGDGDVVAVDVTTTDVAASDAANDGAALDSTANDASPSPK